MTILKKGLPSDLRNKVSKRTLNRRVEEKGYTPQEKVWSGFSRTETATGSSLALFQLRVSPTLFFHVDSKFILLNGSDL